MTEWVAWPLGKEEPEAATPATPGGRGRSIASLISWMPIEEIAIPASRTQNSFQRRRGGGRARPNPRQRPGEVAAAEKGDDAGEAVENAAVEVLGEFDRGFVPRRRPRVAADDDDGGD